MYQALPRSLITLNSHINMVGREAGNARRFEATGVGTFLLTGFEDNLQTLFEPNREVVAWRSVNECHCGPTSVLGAPLTVRPKIAKVPASHAI